MCRNSSAPQRQFLGRCPARVDGPRPHWSGISHGGRSTWPPLERKLLTLVYNLGLTTVHISMGYQAIIKRLWILAATISGAIVSNSAFAAGSVETCSPQALACKVCHGA